MNQEIEVICKKCDQQALAELTEEQVAQGWDCPNCGATNHGK